MNNNEISQYLDLLHITRSQPSVESLAAILRAHLYVFPFENISKLYYFKKFNRTGIPDLEHFLDGARDKHFGGTCYAINYYLSQLLTALGYQTKLCGADMQNPDAHVVNIVTLAGKEYIVDAGYAAPFSVPLPRYLQEPFSISHGVDEYILFPQDGFGRSRLEQYHEGTLRHSYLVKPEPRNIDDFSRVIADSFAPKATFMNAVLLVKYDGDNSIVIRNKEFITTRDGLTTKVSLNSFDHLVETIQSVFGIPPEITRVALKDFSL